MMKRILLMTFAVLVCGCLAAAEQPSFGISDMLLKLVPTPIPAFKNYSSRSKASSNNRWLRMETVFVPKAFEDKTREQWYDDVTMEGTLVITRYKNGKFDSYAVLTGKTRFFTINADEKEHFACFYVPPKLLERYCGSGITAEKSIRMARVAFYGPGRVLLGEGYWALDGSGKKGRFLKVKKASLAAAVRMKEYEKNYSNVMTLRGGLYSKEKTPWHHADYDFYDLVYDNVLQQDSGNIKK